MIRTNVRFVLRSIQMVSINLGNQVDFLKVGFSMIAKFNSKRFISAVKFFIRANPKMKKLEHAAYLGVHVSTVGKWLDGTRIPTKRSAVLVFRGIRKHRRPNPSVQLLLDCCGK